MKELLGTLFKGVELGDAIIDALLLLGFLRHSKRRGKKVPNEKHLPRFAIDDWHRQQYTKLCSRLTAHEQLIMDDWMQNLEEAQQAHFKVSVANLSWTDNPAEKDSAELVAINFLKEMALLSTHNERTAKADARDYIKDPATEYFLVRAEKFAKKRFNNLKDLERWLIDTSPDGFLAFLRWADNRIEGLTVPQIVRARNALGVTRQARLRGTWVQTSPQPPRNLWGKIPKPWDIFSLSASARRFK